MISAKSKLEYKLRKGKFIITSEFNPSKGVNIGDMKEKAEILKKWVDVVNVSDFQGSNLSMGNLAAAHLLKDWDIEPILQITCRDRNRLALQSDILSAYTVGIRNILVLTGDYPTIGDHPSSYPVFDLDSVQLLWAIAKLESGIDLAGKRISKCPIFFKGAAIKVESDTEASYELQLIKIKKKVEFGAQFFQTMPIFDEDNFKIFIERVRKLNIDIPIIAGIQLLKSSRMANYINRNLPGINVPQNIIDKMARTKDELSASIDIAASIINKIKPYCEGIHIGAQGWEEYIPTLIKNIDTN